MPNYDDKDIIIYRPKQASGKYSDVDYYREDIMFPSLLLLNNVTASSIIKYSSNAPWTECESCNGLDCSCN